MNNAFYRLPEANVFRRWAQATPDDFVVAVKASRYLTHVRRLRQPAEPVGRLVERIRHLGGKLGPVLLQLPPNLACDLAALDGTLAAFPSDVRVAVEPRHPSWFVDDTRELLERRRAALCLADRPGLRAPRWRTTDWIYVRFHEGRASPRPCYGRRALASWTTRLAELARPGDDLYVYFNNDTRACAPRDARHFAAAAERAGLAPSRVPAADEVHLEQ